MIGVRSQFVTTTLCVVRVGEGIVQRTTEKLDAPGVIQKCATPIAAAPATTSERTLVAAEPARGGATATLAELAFTIARERQACLRRQSDPAEQHGPLASRECRTPHHAVKNAPGKRF